MKRIYIILTLSIVCCMAAMAQNRPDIAHQTTGEDRYKKQFGYSERPVVYYDSDRKVIEISGSEEYYNVFFNSQTTDFVWVVTAYGPSDEISVMGLLDGVYTMTVSTPVGTSFVWTFRKGTESDLQPSGLGSIIQPKSVVGNSALDLLFETM